jgi:RES domain-containing protein
MGSVGGHGGARVSPTRLAAVEPRPFSGVAYRIIGSRFLASPLVSAGSRARGGRFNPPGEFEVLYTALSVDTAFAERDGFLLTAAGIKAARAVRTGVLLKIVCRLSAVLDLTDERVRKRLGLSLGDLLGPWVPWNVVASGFERRRPALVTAAPGQALGRVVYASGRFEAILSPSAKDPGGRCLAILAGRLRDASSVTIDDPTGIIRGALGLRDRPASPTGRHRGR